MLNFSNPSQTLKNLIDSDLIGTNIFEYNLETIDKNTDIQTNEVKNLLFLI